MYVADLRKTSADRIFSNEYILDNDRLTDAIWEWLRTDLMPPVLTLHMDTCFAKALGYPKLQDKNGSINFEA